MPDLFSIEPEVRGAEGKPLQTGPSKERVWPTEELAAESGFPEVVVMDDNGEDSIGVVKVREVVKLKARYRS